MTPDGRLRLRIAHLCYIEAGVPLMIILDLSETVVKRPVKQLQGQGWRQTSTAHDGGEMGTILQHSLHGVLALERGDLLFARAVCILVYLQLQCMSHVLQQA